MEEGTTDLLTSVVSRANNIARGDSAYPAQAGAVQAVLDTGRVTIDDLAEWYMGRDYFLLDRKLGATVFQSWREAMDQGNWSLAKRQLKRQPPPPAGSP